MKDFIEIRTKKGQRGNFDYFGDFGMLYQLIQWCFHFLYSVGLAQGKYYLRISIIFLVDINRKKTRRSC